MLADIQRKSNYLNQKVSVYNLMHNVMRRYWSGREVFIFASGISTSLTRILLKKRRRKPNKVS